MATYIHSEMLLSSSLLLLILIALSPGNGDTCGDMTGHDNWIRRLNITVAATHCL